MDVLDAQIALSSPAFRDEAPLPRPYTADGPDASPPLAWSGVPQEARELVLVCDDVDDSARAEPPLLWLAYGLDPSLRALPEGISGRRPPSGPLRTLREGVTAAGRCGWSGPRPPRADGPHRYVFRLFALDERVGPTTDGASRDELFAAMKGRVIARGEVVAIYAR